LLSNVSQLKEITKKLSLRNFADKNKEFDYVIHIDEELLLKTKISIERGFFRKKPF